MHPRLLIPVPKNLFFLPGTHLLSDRSVFALPAPFRDRALELAGLYWNIHPCFRETPASSGLSSGEYAFAVDPETVSLNVRSEEELLDAFKTLRQMAEPQRGVLSSSAHILPCAEVRDSPGLPFRGIHLCYFQETEEVCLEKMVRMAAACKFNYAVIEFWGTFPCRSHPEFQWEEKRGNREFLEKLTALARSLGITLIPQINLLGHASGSSISNGKHVVLDRHPEFGPLFEPDGWSWCLSNPAVRQVQSELLAEVAELFGTVPFVHLGFDEAFNIATCTECAKHALPDLMLDHILFLHGELAKYGSRMILWHDMFLELDKEKWGDCVILDRNRANPSDILEKLPRDILMAVWHYNAPPSDPAAPLWPTADHFASLGFHTVLCPWTDERGILSMAEKAADRGLDGILQTTWNATRGAGSMRKYFFAAANKAWARSWEPEAGFADELMAVNRMFRMITQDMHLTRYEELGCAPEMTV